MNPAEEKPRKRRHNVQERARRWLTKGALVRDDSDDELGDEDHPWEWIYEDEETEKDDKKEPGDDNPDDAEDKPSLRRSSRPSAKHARKIVGARMGSFECRLGQTVLLKSPEPGKDWAGIICEFLEVEDEENEGEMVKSANIMWFASPDEFLSTRNKKRADALPNEQYLTADFNVNPLTSINGKANVMSKDVFYAKYPNGTPPTGKAALAEYHKSIICRRGVNQLQGKYTDEFIWEDVYKNGEAIFELIDMIKAGLKAAKKRKAEEDEEVSTTAKDLIKEDTNFICIVCGRERGCPSDYTQKEAKVGIAQCNA